MRHSLVLLRHGESEWNKENRFTGWTDVDLSDLGRQEAEEAGVTLRDHSLDFDIAYTSVLRRAIKTLWLALEAMDHMWLQQFCNWRLNERHYGALQGLGKQETAERYGEEQVHLWRRSYRTRPPALDREDPRFPGFDAKYKGVMQDLLPLTESLADTVARIIPFWEGTIAPKLREGKRVLVVAHGNSLRALVSYVQQLPEQAVVELNIPTGIPLVYELDDQLRMVGHQYLASEDLVKERVKRAKGFHEEEPSSDGAG